MQRFIPSFQGAPWPSGTTVLHAYLTPSPDDRPVFDLAARARAALQEHPLLPLPDEYLHIHAGGLFAELVALAKDR